MRSNLVAGLTSSVWSATIGLTVVPLYLKYLGIEAYGLIGILSSAQALFSLLDLGLAPTINREVARGKAAGDLVPARQLLHTLSLVYWLTAAAIALSALAIAPLIANRWVPSSSLSPETERLALVLIGFVIACRWPVGLYLGALVGAERVVLSSGLSIAMSAANNLGGVIVLVYMSQRIEVFFGWQALVGLAYALAMRHAAWHVVGHENKGRFSMPSLVRVWRFSAGLSGITLAALLLTQIDKIVLSSLLSLSSFGQYTLATMVASGLYLFINPTFNVIYPRFTALVSKGDSTGLSDLYRWTTRLFATFLFPVAMVLALFAEDLVRLWTGNEQLAATIAPVIAMLAAGSALHGVMHFPYALQLAYGKTRLPLTISLGLIVLALPLMAGLSWIYGIRGGAAAWLLLHVIYLLIGNWLTHRQLLKGIARAWLCFDVGVPLGVSVAVGFLGAFVLSRVSWTGPSKIALAALLLCCAWLATVALAPRSTLQHLRRLVATIGNDK